MHHTHGLTPRSEALTSTTFQNVAVPGGEMCAWQLFKLPVPAIVDASRSSTAIWHHRQSCHAVDAQLPDSFGTMCTVEAGEVHAEERLYQ